MVAKIPSSIKQNLHFLSVEVDSQLANLQKYFSSTPSPALARRILGRSGYAYNLKTRIHGACIDALAKGNKSNSERLFLRSIELVSTDLERITEYSRSCLKQMDYVENIEAIQHKYFSAMIGKVRTSVSLVKPALLENSTEKALKIGQVESKLEASYKKLHKASVVAIKSKSEVSEDLINGLFLAKSIHHMGECLLEISESIVSANIGQPVNFERYHSIQAMIGDLDPDENGLQLEPIAETRSGSAISGISKNGQQDDYVAIFKDGLKSKVKEEREGVKSWHEVYPGLAPRILSYKKRGESAALLIEHLPGLTFEQIVLKEPKSIIDEALKTLGLTLRSVWKETQSQVPAFADHMTQMEKRLSEVYKIHPEFEQNKSTICDLRIPSFSQLVKQCKSRERALRSPFSVYIHGDFNLDNIIYDTLEKRINFIDLHRSRYMDYVQDVSVFMVSNYRLQTLDAPLRQRVMDVALEFYKIARRFAGNKKDVTFELRLALGLARSFATSTRFILDKYLAKQMFLRARYLLELVIAADLSKPEKFKLPLKEIFVD